MKRIIKKSNVPFIKDYKGFLYCKKALYYADGEASYKITNILSKAKPFKKSVISIENFTKKSLVDIWASQEYLEQGASPDLITMNSAIVQPRKGAIRIWKEASTGSIYLRFLDVYNNAVLGRPTDLIAKMDSQQETWDGYIKFPLDFFSEDMSKGHANLFNGYTNNDSNFQNIGPVTYQGQTYNLPYADIVVSWCRISNVDSNFFTWVVIDDGYSGINWVPLLKNDLNPKWNKSIMTMRFFERFIDNASHWDNILDGPYTTEILNAPDTVLLFTGLGDVIFVLTYIKDKYSISFKSENSLATRDYILNCKLSADDYIKQFNLIYNTNYTITFNSNAKLLIKAFGDGTAIEQEIFIDIENKQLFFIR